MDADLAPTGETPEPQPRESVHLEAHASGHATINQAALHVSYGHGVGQVWRTESGAKDAECPYPGLLAFGRGEARWFFGRDKLTAQLVERLVVGPMSQDELREAIRYPAQNVDLDVEDGLIELLLRDLGDTAERGTASYAAGRLPLLAHALRGTWQQRHGHTLTVAGYLTTGGIHQAVATTAEDVYTDLDQASQRVARTLFLRLVKIGDDGPDTRRRVARTELPRGLDVGVASPVVDAFTGHRLLTQDRDTVEITHEALLRAWPRLTEWIGEDRAGHLIRQTLDDDAASWDRPQRLLPHTTSDSGPLHRPDRHRRGRPVHPSDRTHQRRLLGGVQS
jgi:hypothetical protein